MESIREFLPPCQDRLPAPTAQLALPTGPVAIVRRRRERTDTDKGWHSEQVKAGMEIKNLFHRAIYQQMTFLASCNIERLCFASHTTIASKLGIATKSVQRAVKVLERDGLLQCQSQGTGRTPGRYLIRARRQSPCSMDFESTLRGLKVHQIKEGIEHTNKALSINTIVKSIDPAPIQTEGPEKAVVCTTFPSQEERKKAKAPVRKEQVQKAPEPVFKHPRQVALLFKLQRKLDYRADDGQAGVFDGLEHGDKKRILDKLLAEEQLAAVRGEVEAPPPKPRAPRFDPISTAPTAPTRAEPPACVTHRWAEPASDGISNCTMCSAEQISVGA